MASLFPYYVHSRYENWRVTNKQLSYSKLRQEISVLQDGVRQKIKKATLREQLLYQMLKIQGGSCDECFKIFTDMLINSQTYEMQKNFVKRGRGRVNINTIENTIASYYFKNEGQFRNLIGRDIERMVKTWLETGNLQNLRTYYRNAMSAALKRVTLANRTLLAQDKKSGIFTDDTYSPYNVKHNNTVIMQFADSYTTEDIAAACERLADKFARQLKIAANIEVPDIKLDMSGIKKAMVYSEIEGEVGEFIAGHIFQKLDNTNVRVTGRSYTVESGGTVQAAADVVFETVSPTGLPVTLANGKKGKIKNISTGVQVKNWNLTAKSYRKYATLMQYQTIDWSGHKNIEKINKFLGADGIYNYEYLTYLLVNSIWFNQKGSIGGTKQNLFTSHSQGHTKLDIIKNNISTIFNVISLQNATINLVDNTGINDSERIGKMTIVDERGKETIVSIPPCFWIIGNTMVPLRKFLEDLLSFLNKQKTSLGKFDKPKIEADVPGISAIQLYLDKDEAARRSQPNGHEISKGKKKIVYFGLWHPGEYNQPIVDVGSEIGKQIASSLKITANFNLMMQQLQSWKI